MRKVLIIANQFPPMGGSGVQRSVKFVKHLRSFGLFIKSKNSRIFKR